MPGRDIRDTRPKGFEEDSDGEPAAPLDPMLLNLSQEQQDELVQIVLEDLRNGIEARSRADWGTNSDGDGITFDDKYAGLVKLYEGEDQKRPEKWMCGRSLKIAQSVVELLVARLIPSVWNENSHRWRPVEWTDKTRVAAMNKIMGWVLNVWMKLGDTFIPNFVRNGVMMGSVIVETRWDRKKYDMGKTEQIPLMGEDGNPLLDESGQPMTVESKLLVSKEKPVIDIIPLTRVITQPDQKDIQDEPVVILEDFYYHELENDQKQGFAQNVTDKLKSEVKSKIASSLEKNLAEAERIDSFNAKVRMANVEGLRWYGAYDADGDGFEEEICCVVAKNEEVFIRAYKNSVLSRRGLRPLVHTAFVPRLFKFFGIGVLEQVMPLALEIDACFRQLQDANTLSIMRWGFYDPNSDYDPDEHVAKPRAMYPVTNPTQNVYFPDIQIPVERLLNAIRLVMEFVERLTAASSYALGKESEIVGGSGTATRTAAIMSSADIRFNMPAASLRAGLAEIITNIADLCYMNMPDGLEKRIVGQDGEMIFENSQAVEDAMLQEMDCYLLPNPSFGDANTARQLATLLYDKFVLGGNPLVVGDMGRLWHASANIFEAYGEEPIEWLGTPPSKKETNDPVVELTLIREGRVIRPEPQENHLEHIMVHTRDLETIENSPEVLLWPKEALMMLRQHIEDHKQMMAMIMQFQSAGQKGANPNANGGSDESGTTNPAKPTANGATTEPGFSGSNDPSQGTPENQVAGTTLGSPQVR